MKSKSVWKRRVDCNRCGRAFTVHESSEETLCARCRYTRALEERVRELEGQVAKLTVKLAKACGVNRDATVPGAIYAGRVLGKVLKTKPAGGEE